MVGPPPRSASSSSAGRRFVSLGPFIRTCTLRRSGHNGDDLRAGIEHGEPASGARLSSERDLAARCGTACNAARDAISILQGEGPVVAPHGRGVFVRPPIHLGVNRYGATGLSPSASKSRTGPHPATECRSVTREGPSPDVADRLCLDPATARVVRRENPGISPTTDPSRSPSPKFLDWDMLVED
ncbi:GntR family transcriptional regulator [Actinoplanes sp. NPDC026623]|uniref:GntR family transcriptional regulator n=1 Tax=Actinoplanes sp. NPDC026623 TaxID=3155610 RepID=UPI0034057A21